MTPQFAPILGDDACPDCFCCSISVGAIVCVLTGDPNAKILVSELAEAANGRSAPCNAPCRCSEKTAMRLSRSLRIMFHLRVAYKRHQAPAEPHPLVSIGGVPSTETQPAIQAAHSQATTGVRNQGSAAPTVAPAAPPSTAVPVRPNLPRHGVPGRLAVAKPTPPPIQANVFPRLLDNSRLYF